MTTTLTCEVSTATAAQGEALAHIIKTCADELAQPLVVRRTRHRRSPRRENLVTLELPVDIAAAQHEAWCLACRISCFCPDTRVSVLVLGGEAFGCKGEPARELTALWA
jgi:hypothetical protein